MGCLALWLYNNLDLSRFFSSLAFYTDGRTPWTGDQPVARPIPANNNTNTINAQNTDIHVLSGIRTHDPSVRAGEEVYALDRTATMIGYELL
jgi:hypothetical protein